MIGELLCWRGVMIYFSVSIGGGGGGGLVTSDKGLNLCHRKRNGALF